MKTYTFCQLYFQGTAGQVVPGAQQQAVSSSSPFHGYNPSVSVSGGHSLPVSVNMQHLQTPTTAMTGTTGPNMQRLQGLQSSPGIGNNIQPPRYTSSADTIASVSDYSQYSSLILRLFI